MQKINPYVGLAILLGVIGLLLFFMKVDPAAFVLKMFFVIYGSVQFVQLIRKRLLTNMWGFVLLLLATLVIVQAIIGLWTAEFYWVGIAVTASMHSLIYQKIHPKEMF
jgi:hypothetical protein